MAEKPFPYSSVSSGAIRVPKPTSTVGGAHKMKMMNLVGRNRGMAKSVVIVDLRISTMTQGCFREHGA